MLDLLWHYAESESSPTKGSASYFRVYIFILHIEGPARGINVRYSRPSSRLLLNTNRFFQCKRGWEMEGEGGGAGNRGKCVRSTEIAFHVNFPAETLGTNSKQLILRVFPYLIYYMFLLLYSYIC